MRDSPRMELSLSSYARAVPLNAIAAFGLGPIRVRLKRPASALTSLRDSDTGTWYAIETAGTIGRLVMGALAALDGEATADEFAFQTRDADPDDITGAVDRLEAAGILVRTTDGSVRLTDVVMKSAPDPGSSLGAPNAMTSDALAKICSALHVKAPPKKAERVQAITEAFADALRARAIRDGLSSTALDLLDRIATQAGPMFVDSDDVGIAGHLIHYTATWSYSRRDPSTLDPSVTALVELTKRGIVGVRDWGSELWIWREAWPLVDRPFYTEWPSVRPPEVAPTDATPPRIPAFVVAFDHALSAWRSEPPVVLKNGDPRVGKTQVRATAKLLDLDPTAVDLAGRLAVGMGLLLENVVGSSGRGRNRRVDQVWAPDEPLVVAWAALGPAARWARAVAEWTRPNLDHGKQLLANRHLVLWELAALDDGVGYADADAFGEWIFHRHGPIGHGELVAEVIEDLRALGVVEGAGPLALTAIGRIVLEDPASLDALPADDATTAIVQADLTVIAPPDLRHDLAAQLAALADVESESGAVVSRLSIERITRAVQGGETAESILDFLTRLSSVPIGDTVTRLVQDAAARAGRVQVISAPTVVVVNDPVDLAIALSVKAAKLVRVSETVAISELPHAKVRSALDRKGLAPELVTGSPITDAQPKPSSLDAARRAEQQATEFRALAARTSNRAYARHADSLELQAKRLGDVDGRLAVKGPLAVMPRLVEQLDASTRRKSEGVRGTPDPT